MMVKRDNYLAKYYEKATIDRLAEDYARKGYEVKKQSRLGKMIVDLHATKGEQNIYIEVKGYRMDAEARKRMEMLENIIRELPNSKLIVVTPQYSEDKVIEIDGIEGIFLDYFLHDFPSELDELSTHTQIDSVDSITIDIVKIYGLNIIIKCSGHVSVTLQYGSDSEQEGGALPTMSFPFDFEGTLTWKDDGYEVSETDHLRIDTGEFYK